MVDLYALLLTTLAERAAETVMRKDRAQLVAQCDRNHLGHFRAAYGHSAEVEILSLAIDAEPEGTLANSLCLRPVGADAQSAPPILTWLSDRATAAAYERLGGRSVPSERGKDAV